MTLSCKRYDNFELKCTINVGKTEAKILFIVYAPDICDTKAKFLIATTKNEFRKKLQPFNKEVQVNDQGDFGDESNIKYFKQ